MPLSASTVCRAAAAAALAAAALPDAAWADEEVAPNKSTFTIGVENDLFWGVDRHYTNGLEVSWLSAADDIPDWARNLAGWVPFLSLDGLGRWGLSVNQSMFTPEDIKRANPDPKDRPYAGWLNAGIGFIWEDGRQLDRVNLQLGVVGPSALGEPAQKFVHEIINSPIPQGWDYQLKDEPGLLLTYEKQWRALLETKGWGMGVDLTPVAGFSLGNVYTSGAAGMTLRIGQHLPSDYGPPRIRPSLPGSHFFDPVRGFAWYLFVGGEGRAVARNIFIDGNTWTDSRRVDRKPLVGDIQGGLVGIIGPVRLALTNVYRTREFDGQDQPDFYSAVSLSLKF